MRLFKKKKDEKIIENYVLQTEKVRDATKLLVNVYDALLNLNYNKLDEITGNIEKIRDEVCLLGKDIELELYKGNIITSDKYIFVELSQKIEKVVEKLIQTVRAISLRAMPLPGVNFLKNSDFKTYIDDTITTSELLYESIKNMFNEEKNTDEICHSIKEYEKKIDVLKLKMLKDLHKMEKDIEIFTILQIENIIHRIDEISDTAEDASDIIILMQALQLD
ncbi:MAG: DUF47 domain-containing protein [Thermoplasmata archaeon]